MGTSQLDVTAVGRPIYNNYVGTMFAYGKRERWFDRVGMTVHETSYVSDTFVEGSGTQFVYFNRLGLDISDYFNVFVDAIMLSTNGWCDLNFAISTF